MAWQVRRSIKVGPVRFNVSNSGFSTSVGNKLARVTVNSKGQVRTTQRIPGTGMYNTTLVNPKRSPMQQSRSYQQPEQAAQPQDHGHQQFAQPQPEPSFQPSNHLGTAADFPAEGWYLDPLGYPLLRYWNGTHWQKNLKDIPADEKPQPLTDNFPQDGWYPDPDEPGKECYWMQNQWTTTKRPEGSQVEFHLARRPRWSWRSFLELFRPSLTTASIMTAIYFGWLVINGANIGAAKLGYPLSLIHSFLYSFAMVAGLFGVYKGLFGRPTFLGLPYGRAAGWVLALLAYISAAAAGALIA
jgi:hypothetical protein